MRAPLTPGSAATEMAIRQIIRELHEQETCKGRWPDAKQLRSRAVETFYRQFT